MWQSDFTHWRLEDGTDVEVLAFIDYRHVAALWHRLMGGLAGSGSIGI